MKELIALCIVGGVFIVLFVAMVVVWVVDDV